jgi:signal transduction histidine kinase
LDEAIDRAGAGRADRFRELAARVLQAEQRGDAAAQRQRFLSEASRILAESLDYTATLATVARLAVPDIADWCVVDLVQEGGTARVAIEHRDPAKLAVARQLQGNFPPRREASFGPSNVIRTGETEFESHIPPAALREIAPEPERLRLLEALGLNSYISVPLRTRGKLLGAISFFTEEGRPLSADDVVMAEDLARRAATAIDNARLYEEAQRAIRARDDVLAIVTHDLRTPLSAVITGAATLALAAPSTEDGFRVRRRAEAIQRSAQRMTRLIGDLTDISHIEAGHLAITPAPSDAAALARDVTDALQTVAAERGAELLLDVGVTTDLTVVCDGDRIVQVLSNLASNAMKAGARHVTIAVKGRSADVLFTVSDDGPGIRAEDLPHMFDRYWRGEKTRYKGTGLGLPISKGIVTAHGGAIWVESEVGKGSRFLFTLPRSG